ncbi:glycosyltransferase 87 family protein [Propionibacterium sp.]|uniref:glycosyltransferase 87 family protein n=1 Tax=Propionibacterium sp. TaxID=1977903 RepID=UPI0039EB024F
MTVLVWARLRRWWSRPRVKPLDDWLGLVAWMVSRSLMVYVFVTQTRFISDDVQYYFTSIDSDVWTATGDLSHSLVEYPVPVVWIMQAVRLVSGPSENVYVFTFALLLAAMDVTCCWVLWTRVSRLSSGLWMLFTFLIGPLVWFRIDLIPAVCVLVALKELERRPRLAGGAIALGAATKLWPALLIVPMLGLHRTGRRRGLGFLVTGLAIGLASLATEGFVRSASPLTWQSARGLQVESVWATGLMLARLGPHGHDWVVHLSRFNAYEIYGPGTGAWTTAANVSMIVLIVLVVVLGWFIGLGGIGLPRHTLAAAGAHSGRRDRELAITLSTLAIVCGVIIANKTFSPQYMIWLTGPFAVLIAAQLRSEDRRHAIIMLVLGLVAAGLTQFEFPLNYSGLVQTATPGITVTVVLAVRNVLMVVLTVYASVLALRASWRVGLVHHRDVVVTPVEESVSSTKSALHSAAGAGGVTS